MQKLYLLKKSIVKDYLHLASEDFMCFYETLDKRLTNFKVEASQLNQFLSFSGLTLSYCKPTSETDVYEISLHTAPLMKEAALNYFDFKNQAPEFPVQISHYSGSAADTYTSLISQILTPVVKKKIIFSVPHGATKEMRPRGAFQVNVWSSPNLEAVQMATPPQYLWEHEVRMRDSAFTPSEGFDESLIIRHEGYAVAEVCSNALYIYHDAVHCRYESTQAIFTRILLEAAKILGADIDFEKIEAERESRLARQKEEQFERFVSAAIPRNISRNKAKFEALKEKVKKDQISLYKSQREMSNFNLSKDKDSAVNSIMDDFRKIKDYFDVVSDLYIKDDRLVVDTNEIISYDKHNGNYHNLGEVRMSFNFGGSDPDVTMRGINSSEALPHCNNDGNGYVCLGNVVDDVNAYLANYEIMTAVSLMTTFLQKGINSKDEWGCHIKNFPIVEMKESI